MSSGQHQYYKIVVFVPLFLALLQIQQNSATEKKALRMVRTSIKSSASAQPTDQQPKYFDPKAYTSADLPKLLDGFGRQVQRDLQQAHSLMLQFEQKVELLQKRVDRLAEIDAGKQKLQPNEPSASASPQIKYLPIICVLFGLALALLLAFCCVLLVKSLKQKKKQQHKHVPLANEVV